MNAAVEGYNLVPFSYQILDSVLEVGEGLAFGGGGERYHAVL